MARPLFLSSLFCVAMAAHGETTWFTLAGTPGDDRNDYIQIDPASVRAHGRWRTLALRVSRHAERTSTDGVRFRSFTGTAEVDCMNQTSRFTSSTFFGQAHFAGAPVAMLVYDTAKTRPVAFRNFEGDYARRLIAAACSVGASPVATP